MKKHLRKVTATLFVGLTCLLFSNQIFATKTTVAPGSQTLRAAIIAAASGDTLELSSGNYDETDSVRINKTLTIRAASSATSKPIVTFTMSTTARPAFALMASSISLSFKGIEIAGAGTYSAELVDNQAGATLTLQNFKVLNCTVHGFPRAFRFSRTATFIDSIVIDNCVLYDKLYNATAGDYQLISFSNKSYAKALKLTNSTIYNNTGGVLEFRKASTTDSCIVEIDKCTFYKAGGGESTTKYTFQFTPATGELARFTLKNSVFSTCYDAATARPITLGYAVVQLNNSVFHNFNSTAYYNYNIAKIFSISTITLKTNKLDTITDPTFKDVASYDFSLPDTSSLLIAATDGGQIGDPRWINKSNALLKSVSSSNGTISFTDPYSTKISNKVSYGTTAVPTITATAYSPYIQGIAVTPAATLSDSAVITVTANDGTKKTYKVGFEIASLLSNNDTLKSITLDGVLIDSFARDKMSYHIIKQYDQTTVPVIAAVAEHSGATVSIVKQPVTNNDTVTIKVTAESGAIAYYVVYLKQLSISSDASLQSFQYGSPAVVINAVNGQTEYNVGIEYKAAVPTITATSTVTYKTTVAVTNATAIPGTTTILVTAQDGTTKTYTLNLSYSKESNAFLKALKVNGADVTGFAYNTYAYSLYFADTVTFPANIVATPDTSTATVKITNSANTLANGALACLSAVTVTAPDGVSQKTYNVNYTIGSTDATVSNLKVNGTTITGFSPATLTYTYILPNGTTAVPTVEATKNDANSTMTIVQPASASGKGTVTVVSQNGGVTKKYEITFVVGEKISTLAMIKVTNDSVDNFKSDSLEYNVTVPFGTDSSNLKIVVTKTSMNASSKISWTKLPGIATIKVYAQDTNFVTIYKLNIAVESASTDATLSDIKLYDATINNFMPTVYTYYIPLSDTTQTIPTVTAIATYSKATITTTQAKTLDGTAIINVVAQDTAYKSTYTIRFAVKTGMNNESVAGLIIKQTDYKVILSCGNIITNLIITDLNGRILKAQKSNSSEISVNTEGMTGIYIFSIETNNKTYFRKINIVH
jgi:hypothetical protein